jgi:hypothetical protein
MRFIVIFFSYLIFSCQKENKKTDEVQNPKELNEISAKVFNNKSVNLEKNILDYLNEYSGEDFKFEKDVNNVGFIIMSEDFDFYKNSIIVNDSLNNELLQIEFSETDIITRFNNKKYRRNNNQNPLDSWFFNLNSDYFHVAFLCEKIDYLGYHVRLNKNQLGFVNKNDKRFEFVSIDSYVEGFLALGLDFKRDENPLRNSPNEESEILNNELEKKYKIWNAEFIEMKGEWIKVKTEVSNETGWIRWKNKNKMNIRMHFTC